MKILVHQAFVNDLQSPYNGKIVDILIEQGFITRIEQRIDAEVDITINKQNLHISTGWVDIFSNFNDPGFEYKETLETGAAAAAAGGFTDVFVLPNTKPAIDTKSQVEYIVQKSKALPVTVHPIGAVTKGIEGKDLAEMYDMHDSGAIAFSDGIQPIQSAGLLLKAMQYIRAFDGVIIQIPDDCTVGANGLMNEGMISTRLGLPGKPAVAEELIIQRDIKLAEYAESRIHFTGVSSSASVECIRRAKISGLHVTCSVTPYHLFFTDEDLQDYDTNLKVFPPLRDKENVAALKEAVLDGTIDMIASHHLPHETDSKILEFEYAKYGMVGLETAFGVLRAAMPALTEQKLVQLLSYNPRKVFGLAPHSVQVGNPAKLTLFDFDSTWVMSANDIKSKSKNSPFIDTKLKGKVHGIINGTKLSLHN